MFKRFTTVTLSILVFFFPIGGSTRTNVPPINPPKSATNNLASVACTTCSLNTQSNDPTLNLLSRIEALDSRTKLFPLMPVSRSVFEGESVNLVSTSTGHVAFSITDLEVSGVMPMQFQRVYANDSKAQSGLGTGWSFAYDDRITINGDAASTPSVYFWGLAL